VDGLTTLGHTARPQILEALAEEVEDCVCHLEWRLGLQLAHPSQQTARLCEIGTVNDRLHGHNFIDRLSLKLPD